MSLCVHVCFLVHQHLCLLIMTVMICQQLTYAPKKHSPVQLQLLFTVAVPPSVLLRLRLTEASLYVSFPHAPTCHLWISKLSYVIYFSSHIIDLAFGLDLLQGGNTGVKFV